MQTTIEYLNPTTAKLKITADSKLISDIKQKTLLNFSKTTKLAGFRLGHAPLNLVEKQVDSSLLQTEFLDQIVNQLYVEAVSEHNLRPVNRPTVTITKFVPFTELAIDAEVEVVSKIELPKYRDLKLAPKKLIISDADVDEVLKSMRQQNAEKIVVDRQAITGDQVTIDFSGRDAKSGEPINGADGKDYPLILGSQTFIPGFEEKLIGLKPKNKTEFEIAFPKDYGVAALQSRKVKFSVTVNKIEELKKTDLDDKFAEKASPFKTLKDLKADIKKQLKLDREKKAHDDYQSDLVLKISEGAKVAIPEILIEEEIDRLEQDEKQNLVYRGQTWEEHLNAEAVSEKEHRERNRRGAEQRVKAGLVLSEISDREGVTVSENEIDVQVNLLKAQYKDPAMQNELERPENRREIRNRIVAEKTLKILESYSATG